MFASRCFGKCTFADFMKCSPIPFRGNEGAIGSGPDMVELTSGYFRMEAVTRKDMGRNEGNDDGGIFAPRNKRRLKPISLDCLKISKGKLHIRLNQQHEQSCADGRHYNGTEGPKAEQREKLITRKGSGKTSKEAVVVVVEITMVIGTTTTTPTSVTTTTTYTLKTRNETTTKTTRGGGNARAMTNVENQNTR
ncbi:hypothetical protein Tco_1541303 [Tanacetum coccineum]